jgi:hypothetical protein
VRFDDFVEFDDVGVGEGLQDVHFPLDALQLFGAQLRLAVDLDRDLALVGPVDCAADQRVGAFAEVAVELDPFEELIAQFLFL